jgi:outer membrane murein-binding lipoprotein Lpp
MYSLHSLRKTFKTILQTAGMDGLMIETLLGHDTGVDRHYYLPSVEELAVEWKKYEDRLLLDFERKAKVAELEDKVKALEAQVEVLTRMIKLMAGDLLAALSEGPARERARLSTERLSSDLMSIVQRIGSDKADPKDLRELLLTLGGIYGKVRKG